MGASTVQHPSLFPYGAGRQAIIVAQAEGSDLDRDYDGKELPMQHHNTFLHHSTLVIINGSKMMCHSKRYEGLQLHVQWATYQTLFSA